MRYGAGKYEVNNRMVDNNKNYENGILSVKGTKKTEIAEKERSVKRVILIVADSLGVGALPDAEKYGGHARPHYESSTAHENTESH